MAKIYFASGLAIVAALEPVSGGETDLIRYALTQGGLLAVVLVLLWSIRKDALGVLKERENAIVVMSDMVTKCATALEKAADAGQQQARAMEQMARAVESMQLRASRPPV